MSREKQVEIIVAAQNKAKGPLLEIRRDLKKLEGQGSSSLSELDKSFLKSMEKADRFNSKLGFVTNSTTKMFKGMSVGAAAYATASINSFSQLNDGISQVNTLYDQTALSQKKMYRDSIEMFRMLPTDLKNITAGIYDTISAGADPELATTFARKFGMGAVAGDSDMATVTKAAMGTMNAYKLEAEDLTRILDLQFMTVKEGITSYSDLASSLGTGVLASASGAGITLEELQGSIALITKNAIPANVATTSLNQLFNKFTDTNVIKEFKEYGVSIQDANKHTRPMIEIFKDLNAQFEKRGLGSEQRKGVLKELLGSEQASRAMAPLISNIKEFEKILDGMNNPEGSMRGAFDDRLKSMKTQFKLFWNKLKADGVEVIETLQPLIDKLMEPLLKEQQLQIDIQELKEKRDNPKNVSDAETYNQAIAELELELKDIEMAPIEELRDALAESVKELNRLNPPLAQFLDIVGGFTLNFVGEEGKGKRDIATGVIGTSIGLTLFSKLFSSTKNILMDIFGTPQQGKTVNGPGNNKGYKTTPNIGEGDDLSWFDTKTLKIKEMIETFQYDLKEFYNDITGSPGQIDLTELGLGSTQTMFYIPEGYEYGGEKFNEFEKRFRRLTEEKQKNKNKEPKSINQVKNKKRESTDGPQNLKEKETIKEYRDKIFKINIPTETKDKKQDKEIDKKNVEKIAVAIREGLEKNEFKLDKTLLKDNLIEQLNTLTKQENIIDNKIDLSHKVQVDAPKVKTHVYVDGKNIPIQKTVIESNDVERAIEVAMRRRGRK